MADIDSLRKLDHELSHSNSSEDDGSSVEDFKTITHNNYGHENDDFNPDNWMPAERFKTFHKSDDNSKRLPTRRPNPNTFNRNALMARENRRKKKEYMENLEKKVVGYRTMNKSLRRMIKEQTEIIDGLRKEKMYYKSILTNKSQILSLVKAVEVVNLLHKDNNVISTPMRRAPDEPTENGTDILKDPFWCEPAANSFSTDFSPPHEYHSFDNWEDLLNSDVGTAPGVLDTMYSPNEHEKQISCEHNYSHSLSGDDSEDAGVCLHVASGKVSLKFCAACHSDCSLGLEIGS